MTVVDAGARGGRAVAPVAPAPPASTAGRAGRVRWWSTGRSWLAAAAVLAVSVALVPLAYLVLRVGSAGADTVLDELVTARVARLATSSLALAAVVTVSCCVLGVGSAFLVCRTDLPGRRVFAVLAAMPLAVPTYLAGFSWVSLVPSMEGFWAAALVLTLCSTPYVFLPVAAALRGTDPTGEEVAHTLGHGRWRTFASVTLPQVRPALAGGALLVALYVLSDFGAVAILRADTFTRAIFVAFDLGFDRTSGLVLATVLVTLTIPLLLGELLTRRRGARFSRTGSGVTRPHTPARLGRWRWPAVAGLAAVCGLALGVPALSLSLRLLAGVSRPESLSQLAAAALTSVAVSLAGAAFTVLLALPVGLLAARVPGRLATGLERLSYLTHALPGLVIGLSLVFLGINALPGLYQTVWLLVLGYAALFLPLAVASVHSAVAQAPPELEEVARSLGRSPAAAFRAVTLPLVAPGVGVGAALVFLTCMKELPATLLLRPTGMDTLATELWTHTSVSAYAAAAPYAALLVLLAAVPTWLLVGRTGTPAVEVTP